VFVIATFSFFGAAAFSVWNGANDRIGICDAVNGLRHDLVEVVREGERRGIENAKEFPEELRPAIIENVKESTRATLEKIDDPSCP
jgi:hypothetical protein